MRMKDIAKEANVSVITVSRVIHNNGYVSKDKRERILNIINKYNYVIDGVAQSLRKEKTNTIGFVMSQIYPDPFQSTIAMFLEKEAKKKKYRLLINNTLGNIEEEEEAVNLFIKYRTDGIIFSYLMNISNVEKVRQANIPFILIERRKNLKRVNAILLDNYKAIEMSYKHLVSKGAKKIGLIGAHLGDEVENQIFESYKKMVVKSGLKFDEDIVYLDWMDSKTGYKGIYKFYKNKKIPDACIIINDITSLGALQALHELKIKVPEDILITSEDNTLSEFTAPPMTSVTFGKERIAHAALELILGRIENKINEDKLVLLKPRLVKRVSTGD